MAKKSTAEAFKEEVQGIQKDANSRGALWISTGSTLADIVVGAGRGLGYELGEVVLLEAVSQAGKSFWSHEIVANAFHGYKNKYPGKFKHQYQDVESGCTFDSKEMFGIEIMPFDPEKRVRPKTIQDCFAESVLFFEGLKKDEYGVCVIDSINGLFDKSGEERADELVNAHARNREYKEKTMGMELSKFLSQTFFKKLNPTVEESNGLFVIVAQYRQKSLPSGGIYYDLQMGEALKYFCNKRVKLTVAETIEVKGKPIGAVIRVETKKARGPWPYRTTYVTMWYTTGIDNNISNIDFLYGLRTAEGKLSTADKKQKIVWDGQEFTRDELVFYIEENDLEQELANRVIAKWNEEEKAAVKQLEGRKKRFQ
jgi:hypothetical protein